MTFKRTFSVAALLLIVTCICVLQATAQATTTRISATWEVEKYDITATVPSAPSDRNLTVWAVIALKNVSDSPARTITFRISPNAEVSAATVNGAAADFSKGQEKIGTGTLQRVIVRVAPVQPGGNVIAAIDYKLNVKENSAVGAMSPSDVQFLPLSFWYPTPNSWFFSRGGDYAPFTIKATVPAGLTLLSSGTSSGGTFETKHHGQPFFLAADLEVTESGGVSVFKAKGLGTVGSTRAGEIADLAAKAKLFVSKYLGEIDAPIRLVGAKRGHGFAGGGTILIDANVFRRSKVDSQTALSIAEGVAKMWVGSSIDVSGDGFGSIREGLPRFLATKFIEEYYGTDVADAERVRQRTAYASVAENEVPLTMLSPLDSYYYSVASNKGAMIWRLLEKRIGRDRFVEVLAETTSDGYFDVAEIRAAVPEQKEFLDNAFDAVADTNLLVGLPVASAGVSKVALRNSGSIDTTVNVEATLDNGETMSAPVSLKAATFGEVSFKTPNKIVRVEIDPEKFYPQTNYTDDVAPRETSEGDIALAVRRAFDRKEYAEAEKIARSALADVPRYDSLRILLARSLLGAGKNTEAAKEFMAVLNEKLPTAQSLAWAHVGMAEISEKAGSKTEALRHANDAIRADADYGASLAARQIRTRLNMPTTVPDDVRAYFAAFDAAARSNRLAELEALAVPGDVTRFVSGISGQTTEWKTTVRYADQIDANSVHVETMLEIKLLNKELETGIAVYRLRRSGGTWKLSAVDIFEVR